MMAGAVIGTLAARPGPRLAVAAAVRVEAPTDAAHARLV
jgi:hypothetical protein